MSERDDCTDLLKSVWALDESAGSLPGSVSVPSAVPLMASSFRVGALAQSTIAAAGLAAASYHTSRGGDTQQVSVDMHHAETEFMSERCITVDGKPAPHLWDAIAGLYQCADDRWIRLHTNFPHHRAGILDILQCDYDRDAVARALSKRSAFDVEDQAAAAGIVTYALRTEEEWRAHQQGVSIGDDALVSIERIDTPTDAKPRLRPAAAQPLTDIRVLDLTRIIAGPVCGRTLAAHGADVLRVTGPHLPSVPVLVMDAGRGKRSAYVDLRDTAGKDHLETLVKDSDVFVQGYRPGAVAGRGFDPVSVATMAPGIVYVSLCAWGYNGPWHERRGYDSLVQSASGINLAESDAVGSDTPGELPCQALDHASGYLMAYGAMRALERQRSEGGSWHVRVSLARTGRFLADAGRRTNTHNTPPPYEDYERFITTSDSGFGAMTHVRHAASLSQTPARWRYPSTPLGIHAADWSGFTAD